VESLWNRRYGQPLKIVSGEWWLAGNVAAYGKHRPRVFPSVNPDKARMPPNYCAWLHDDDLNRRGAVILWDSAHAPDGLQADLYARFHITETVDLPLDSTAGAPSTRIHAAIIPPEEARAK
jgi:hypothetical protein